MLKWFVRWSERRRLQKLQAQVADLEIKLNVQPIWQTTEKPKANSILELFGPKPEWHRERGQVLLREISLIQSWLAQK